LRIKVAATWTIATILSAAFGASQAARAADIPRPVAKAPAVIPVPVSNWTGFYLNGGAGYGLWTAETFTSDPAPFLNPLPLVQRYGGKGWLGRVGGGFDYQFSQRIVAGLFADYDFSDLKGIIADPRVSISAEIKQTSTWAVGGRAGWLINPSLLTYYTGGYSHARFSSGTMVPFAPSVFPGYSTPAFSTGGWFLGGGAETALGGEWFGRTEYRYAYMATRS
jgi:outer membrane immunogenic protein